MGWDDYHDITHAYVIEMIVCEYVCTYVPLADRTLRCLGRYPANKLSGRPEHPIVFIRMTNRGAKRGEEEKRRGVERRGELIIREEIGRKEGSE